MNKNELRTIALAALNKAKALKEEFGVNMDAEKKAQFDAHMAEYTEYAAKYQEAVKTEEQFAALDQGLETFGQPAPSNVGDQGSDLDNGAVQDLQQNAARIERARAIHVEAFSTFMRRGEAALSPAQHRAFMGGGFTREELASANLPEEAWAHLGTVDTLGGFLVPEEFQSGLIQDLAGFTVMRPMARVQRTSSDNANFLTIRGSGNSMYTSGLTGAFKSQGYVQGGDKIPTQNEPQFGRERIPVYTWTPDVIELTRELLDDSSVDLDAAVRGLLAEVRGLDEDSVFILGTGVGMPMGIVTEAAQGNIVSVQSGAANAQTYAGLVNLWKELPAQYRMRASWLMNSVTCGQLALLEDTVGNPIFPTNEIPSVLFGRPMVISEFMPDGDTDGNNAIIFGDFSFYGIADRMDLRIIRLTERFAPNIGLLAMARVGGQMLRAQPFVTQTVGA
jgi:HK97 family phage major capsid protein